MSETRIPKFDWGQRVTASIDLFNDGSHPESELDALLVGQGTAGEVVQVGMHEESSTPVYMVEFDSKRVVGCLEEEIALVQAREE
ncbi:MAG: nitrogen fixation protein NifZ [Oxalobacteraceae bacterium]|nr:nitrogen fixation protein NifZ [Oxalobacteraceae bacterium]